ncbi:MAG: efflux RND transporter permease subunit [Gammaproteobacteria bacterium]
MNSEPPTASRRGPIALFAAHPTAANLVLALMLVCGLFAISKINRQFFPDFGIDFVTVSVTWPGASAEDVDNNIVQAIEPAVRFLGGVDKVISSSYEGLASISIEFEPGTDMQQARAEVDSAIAQIRTFPEDAEEPEVRRVVRYETITKIVLSGDFPEASLKNYAKQIRDELLQRGVDKVDMFGARDEEIWVEVEPHQLRLLDLKLETIANRINQSSQDLPSGELAGGERQIRSLGLKRTAQEIGDIDVIAMPNGRSLQVNDIATVSETFKDSAPIAYRDGQLAIELSVRRAVNTDALEISEKVKTYLAELQDTLPPTLRIEQYDERAKSIKERIALLVNNGTSGLILVLLVLFIFLNARVAIWVAAGIPAAMLAAVAVMWVSGQTINMLSLFGMIMAIGIVVDDAIVVGEHAETRFQQGMSALDASIAGAHRMAAPVTSATLTTVAAFMPLFLVSGIMGQIISAIPFVVIAVLIASLIECFYVLPGHLSHALKRDDPNQAPGMFARFRSRFDARFDHFREDKFARAVRMAITYRYVTLAIALTALLIAGASVIGGRVGYQFFPSPEPDRVYANLEMVAGTSKTETQKTLLAAETALFEAARELSQDADLVAMTVVKLGSVVGGDSGAITGTTDTIGGVVVELKSAEERDVLALDVISRWREKFVRAPNVKSFEVRAARVGPPGRDLDLRIRGDSIGALKSASDELRAKMMRYPGVTDVKDNLPDGKPELILELTPRGRTMGFTTTDVGRQVRNAVDGAIAKRFPRNDEEVWVRVRMSQDAVDRGILDNLYVRSPDGLEVPLTEVVTVSEKRGYARIRRESGFREVAITAEIDLGVTRPGQVIRALNKDGLDAFAAERDINYSFAGRAEEQRETSADMRFGAILGLAFIYIILAWVFASYTRPFVVMSVIPLGFVGAVFGHFVFGADLTILSIFAILGLAGIVINDSIVLVTTIEQRRENEALMSAAVNGACDRLRAVILTSATTIGGLTPLLFERSLQAQFLIPMALTLIFGLAVSTVVVLLLVPALCVIQQDISDTLGRWFGFRNAKLGHASNIKQ